MKEQELLDLLPVFWQDPISCTAIHQSLPRPRVSLPALKSALEALVAAGKVDAIKAGRYTYYRKNHAGSSGIATPVEVHYNGSGRSKSSPEKADSFLRALNPLNIGKSVALWMDDPRRARKSEKSRKKLIVLIPGPVAGLPKGTIVVCVIGSGSCIAWVDQPTKVADLVLAGVPAKLANVLMNAVHRVMH